MDVSERFGENLLRVRQARKLSQEGLAAQAGIHRTQITLLESGRREPRLLTIVRLAGALEVEVSMLLEGITWRPDGPGGGEFVVTDPPELPRLGG
ncbi:MAG TPA: helix-turn-helix transcriptional regulator [Solirubrobacterales bacterium]|jgi:transcriptional regulator with XRE-family HTH domain|nr:helix-turn-helix transcriptional regulator [Solirubrobacterales bacterium]